ncbi:S8 family serine peptidase [Deinococcus geothermalis]|uniref:Peptidase S8, subtilisin n=1 Tax=Deinococcus geothermalis (strain DSM 11300 / CIP 105573 / AG-3a) TaxID=319795 RepID=Q1J2L9_DEIGD|nr:S8 family serine peptidase [Deinococcus geothermalis]ABF44265.1 peptidase S8, subtilisin [Deinococcus geothermalis DSM 11300]
MQRKVLCAAVGLCTAALMVGCGQQASAPPQAQVYRPDYILNVQPQAGDTVSSLEARYHGRVMAFDPEAGYAMIGMDAASAKKFNASRLSTLDLSSEAEPNLNVFSAGGGMSMWAGGAMSMWAGGGMSMWAGGGMSMWAGGQYVPVPGNTAAFTQINLQNAQTLAPNLGQGIEVAVIDTGVDLSHPAFTGALDLANAKDYVDGDSIPQDEGTPGTGAYGHGTAVASIILQVAPKATILPIRVLGPDGSGDAANVALAIRYAADKGAKIINLSLGSDVRVDAVQQAIAYAAGRNVMVVSSAGNSNLNRLTYPAMDASGKGVVADHSVSVGSVDETDRKASFSNYAKELELVAPGVNIYAAVPGNMLGAWSGTSMSAPLAAGSLALAAGQLATLPPDLARKLRDNADNSIYSSNLNTDYAGMLGKGRLNISKFLTAAKATASQ